MRKFNLFIAATVAVTLTTFSCTDDSNSLSLKTLDSEPMQVVVRTNIQDISSKALGGTIAGVGNATINNGMVFFLTDFGHVVARGAIDKAQIQTGQAFRDIKPSATEVYIVANYKPSSVTERALTLCNTKREIISTVDTIKELSGLPNVILTNASDFTGFDANKYNNRIQMGAGSKEANVLLSPALSMIEITDIKTVDPIIEKYRIAGIYIDNFFPGIYMACNKGGAGTKIFGGQTNNLFNDLFVNHDRMDIQSTNGKVMPSPGNKTVIWIYHTSPTLGGVSNIPRIIVVFTSINLKINGVSSVVNNKFLTVTGFRDIKGALIENFEAGKVYTIPSDGFVFRYSDLDDVPNPPRVNITVTTIIKPWVDIPMAPIL